MSATKKTEKTEAPVEVEETPEVEEAPEVEETDPAIEEHNSVTPETIPSANLTNGERVAAMYGKRMGL